MTFELNCQNARSFKGPSPFEALCEAENCKGENKDKYGDGSAEWPVIRGAKKRLHDVGDHRAGISADEKWREEVAKRENKRECRACEEPGKRERKNYAEKSRAWRGSEILRRFEKWARNVFERGVNRQEDKRSVDMGEHQDYCEGAVEKGGYRFTRDVEVLQEAVEDAIAAENRFPGISADQITDPERNDDELIEKFFARTRVKREEVRERITQNNRKQRDGTGDARRAAEHLQIDWILKESGVVA